MMLSFTNRQFGTFDYEENHILRFPDGIIGFEQLKSFILINDEDSEPFRWLVSLEDADLHFPLLEPAHVVANYDRHCAGDPDRSVFVIASLRDRPEESTVNLRSPVVIDPATRTGRQLILDDDTLEMRYPFLAGSGEGKG